MIIKASTGVVLFILLLHISLVHASELVIIDADFQWEVNLEVSEQLRNLENEVKPRIIMQYSSATYSFDLHKIPEPFIDLARALIPSRRLVINQAGFSYQVTLTVPFKIAEGEIDPSVVWGPESGLPQAFALYQNVPNPFNAQTFIGYELPAPSVVTLTIYNLLGQPVCTLVAEDQPAGIYRVGWNGRDAQSRPVSSGVYVYQLSAGKQQAVQRMLLLR